MVKNHFIVGIGASAGGLEAINELFDHIPYGHGFSFVIIQHLSPNHKSLMDELLAKHTSMEIVRAEEGMDILPNHIYLIPNRSNMTVSEGKLYLKEKSSTDVPHHTINIFLESLARDQQRKAIGIVLSGTGSDGTLGLEAIRRHGGYAFVQDPKTAKFDGMPQSAITAGAFDLMATLPEIARELFKYPKQLQAKEEVKEDLGEDADLLAEVLRMIGRKIKKFDFSAYKEQTLMRRMKRRMEQVGVNSLEEYIRFLQLNEKEVALLADEFLIGVTSFFRDPEAFKALEKKVLPEIIRKTKENKPIKIWVVACSTGEEAYTMAMLLCEAQEKAGTRHECKIFATDIDESSLNVASKGVYPKSIEEQVSPDRLKKFFIKEGNTYVVSQAIRRMVIFAEHNVIKDPPFSKMDLISCRNMLIYMKPSLQQKVLSVFHFGLNLGGYLFLGSSENCDYLKASVEVIHKKWNIYQTINKSKNFIFDGKVLDRESGTVVSPIETSPKRLRSGTDMQEAFLDLMTQELGYTALFVNEDNQLLQAIGDYKRFLKLPEGTLELNILKLLPRELSTALNLAIRKAVRNNERIASRWVEVEENDNIRHISLIVQPYLSAQSVSNRFIAVLMKEEETEAKKRKKNEESTENLVDIDRLIDLENELKQAKIDLQATIEELEASNEEMQSSNEELISGNEELQSTNEELQSVNEELHTVNAEHQQKIRELEELNDDLNNFFRSTSIGQVFLDKNLLIRKFTPSAKELINLIEGDIGRPINHLTFNFTANNFLTEIKQAIRKKETIEEEVQTTDGRFFLKRIMPYLRQDKTVDGAVISFVDITVVKNLNIQLQGVLDSSTNGIMAFTLDEQRGGSDKNRLKITLANHAVRNIFELGSEIKKDAYLEETIPALHKSAVYKKLLRVIESGKPMHTEFKFQKKGEVCWLELMAVATETGMSLTVNDISAKKEAEEELLQAYEEVKEAEEKLLKLNSNLEKRVDERTRELAESEERFRLVTQATNDAIWDWNLASKTFWWNEGLSEIFGYRSEEVEAGVESWFNRLADDERDQVIKSISTAINKGHKQWVSEHKFRKADGSFAFVYNRAYIMKNEYGMPYRILGSMVDLTDLKSTQEELEVTNQTLQKINTDLDNFVYTASHDLRAPVANMTGLVDLLKPKVADLMEDREKNLFNMVVASIDKLRNTIDSLVEITQVQQDVDTLDAEVSFEETLKDVCQDLQSKIDKIQPVFELDFKCPSIFYTPIHLRSILFNLMSNALKFHDGDRTLQIKIASWASDDGNCMLSFSDNGQGIPERFQKKMFSMFKRFHRGIEGTGIGLYMVKRIIENHEGSISVSSTPGEGTTFVINLGHGRHEQSFQKQAESVDTTDIQES